MNKYLFVLCFLLIALTFACSTASVRMMPGEKGIHRVVVRDIEKHNAEQEAVEAAREYCDKKKKEAVFLSDETKYSGDMDESARNNIRKGSKAAQILGMGTQNTAGGGVLGAIGTTGSTMTSGKDYRAEVQFRCK